MYCGCRSQLLLILADVSKVYANFWGEIHMGGHQVLPMFQLYCSECCGRHPTGMQCTRCSFRGRGLDPCQGPTKVDVSEVPVHFWGGIRMGGHQALHKFQLYCTGQHPTGVQCTRCWFHFRGLKDHLQLVREHVSHDRWDFHRPKRIATCYAFVMFNLCACDLAPHWCVMCVLLISWLRNKNLLGTGNRKCWPQTCGFPWPSTHCIDHDWRRFARDGSNVFESWLSNSRLRAKLAYNTLEVEESQV